eukprot:TRINITY_DN8056_c0_g1_i1.p1 TRINITY_DN8056_c0_g1~~TRINITY_DN8056_c0_g1_i1.p1  ORF type:complete len:899 (-),score=157.83 TRINITY_DN8056_c0_g1_i1:432-3101(-)
MVPPRSLACFVGLLFEAAVIQSGAQTCGRQGSAEGACSNSSGCGTSLVCSEFHSDTWLSSGEWLTSPSGRFIAVLENSQLQVHNTAENVMVWAAPDPPAAEALSAARILDGQLVLESISGQQVWSSTKAGSTFFRFVVEHTRGNNGAGTQLAELMFWEKGQHLTLDDATIYSDQSSPQHESPAKAVDRNSETKWYTGHSPGASMVLQVPQVVRPDQFGFVTANDAPERDPIMWKLDGSIDGMNWIAMHVQSSPYSTPETRMTATESFQLSEEWKSSSQTDVQALDFGSSAISVTLSDDGLLAVRAHGMVSWSAFGSAKKNDNQDPPENPEAAHKRAMATCNLQLSCQPCIDAGCAWCLAGRRCVADKAWICQGDVDHVSPPHGTIGKAKCPDLSQIQEDHQKRRDRAAAAQLQAPDESQHDARSEQTTRAAGASAPDKAPESSHEDHDLDFEKTLDPQVLAELKWRVKFAESEKGTKPYKVLKVKHDASASEIRKAYRRLSLQFHPDKWARARGELKKYAEKAFSDITQAYETIGSPDKRAAFDDGRDFDDAQGSGDENFYFGDPLIATLTEELWEKRLSGTSIWLIEFYAAWCPHCRNTRHLWKEVAQKLEHLPVEVGAVNCVRQRKICSEYVGVSSYPSIRLLNREYGTMQNHAGGGIDPDAIVKWVEKVSKEWKWLFHNAYVHRDLERASFEPGGIVADSEEMWIVAFMDGYECPACKATSTNLLRLSASLRGLPVKVGTVDCSHPKQQEFCYTEHEVPQPPHRPLAKAWRSGVKNATGKSEPGEVLYGAADLEPHMAFMLIEKVVRLALASQLGDSALVEAKSSGYDEEEKPEEDEPPAGGAGGGWEPTGNSPELLWDDSGISDSRALPKPWVTWEGAQTPQLQR